MKLNKKIFNYIIIKLRNNYKDFDCNNTTKFKNIFYKVDDSNGYQLFSLEIHYHLLYINIDLRFNKNSSIKMIPDNVFFGKYYFFSYKYWILLKYIKLVFKINNCKIINIMEKTTNFFNDKELRNLKLKDLKNE